MTLGSEQIDNSTGLWNVGYFGGEPNYCSGLKDKVFIDKKDIDILRGLANKIIKLSERRPETDKRILWYEHNDLKTKYPVILCDPVNGWNEIITSGIILCKGELAKRWEVVLRKRAFQGEKILDDRPVEPVFEIGYTFRETGWGLKEVYKGGANGSSYIWDASMKSEKDIEKIHFPQVVVDYKTTLETIDLANSIFRDILNVKLRGVFLHTLNFSWDLARFIGLQNMMLYMYDKPGMIHKLMNIILDGYMQKIDHLEDNNLLTLNNDDAYVGSGGIGYTNELPRRNLKNNVVKSIDLWGWTESQETNGVSPGMFEEFIYRYQLPLQKRFGLNCYGCCEALDGRWSVIKNTPNLRRVSVSPWADKKKMAEQLQDKHIYSSKPNPTDLALPVINKDTVRKRIREILEITKGGFVELVMKDTHTFGKNPNNIIDWSRIAREEVQKIYG